MLLSEAVKLCLLLEVDMTKEQLESWLKIKKNEQQPRKARVLQTRWHNKQLLRAQLPEGDEIRVRVHNIKEWRVGAFLQVVCEHDLIFVIDPEWSNRERNQAMARRRRG